MNGLFLQLDEIYSKSNVTEIIVDSYNDVYWEEGGSIVESETIFSSENEILELIKSLLNSVGRDLESVTNGFADLRLSDGTRVAITLPPISMNGPALLVRKIPTHEVTVADLIKWGTFTQEGWQICEKLMRSGKNVLLAGNAGCGKTTIMNTLISAIDPRWRVVTVEKTAELITYGRKRTLRLETPTAKQEEMKELLQYAGLLRADTIVVNEINGSEAFKVIDLMREGYSVLSSTSAEGVYDALKKMEIFCMMDQMNLGSKEMKYHVATGIDAVIFQERLPNGKRVMTNISLVKGLDDQEQVIIDPLYTYDEDSETFCVTAEGKKIVQK